MERYLDLVEKTQAKLESSCRRVGLFLEGGQCPAAIRSGGDDREAYAGKGPTVTMVAGATGQRPTKVLRHIRTPRPRHFGSRCSMSCGADEEARAGVAVMLGLGPTRCPQGSAGLVR